MPLGVVVDEWGGECERDEKKPLGWFLNQTVAGTAGVEWPSCWKLYRQMCRSRETTLGTRRRAAGATSTTP